MHLGLGITTFRNQSSIDNNQKEIKDVLIKGNDDMGHIILGITPQYHLNSNWSLNLDFSSFLLLKQDFTFDNFKSERFNGVGHISALSLGITFRP